MATTAEDAEKLSDGDGKNDLSEDIVKTIGSLTIASTAKTTDLEDKGDGDQKTAALDKTQPELVPDADKVKAGEFVKNDVSGPSREEGNSIADNENSNSNTEKLSHLIKEKMMEGSGDSTAVSQKKYQEENENNPTLTVNRNDFSDETMMLNNTTNNAAKQICDESNIGKKQIYVMKTKYGSAQEQEESDEKPILETLTFGLEQKESEVELDEEKLLTCPCLLCEESYSIMQKEHILAHLVMQHKIVIADVSFIADLPAYLQYWKNRFESEDWTKFCSNIVTNKEFGQESEGAEKEEFYLLCDALPEDKQLRSNLQQKRLEYILSQQQIERMESNFFRQCLFCKLTFTGNRSVLFQHLVTDHAFHMGLADNLVFTDQLFDLIQFKLDNNLCIFCEKKFKDKVSLREHMRKKQHRKINPKNKEYDRFYVINYMEVGKNWECLQSEEKRLKPADEKNSDEEEEWAGWDEDSESNKVVCLFCEDTFTSKKEVHDHMKMKHDFDLRQVTEKLQLNFYQKIKLINYIRRQIYHKRCYGCKKIFPGKVALLDHIQNESDHLKTIPELNIWDQPQYFFPTYEDDNLLCLLDDNDDEGAAGDTLGVTVIAEDIKDVRPILDDAELFKDLKKAL